MRLVLLFLALLFVGNTTMKAQACTDAESGDVEVTPPLPPGGANYPPGTVVEMCFTLFEFDTPQANWFHAVIPVVGPGFDASTLTPVSAPNSCAGTGTWSWYNSWVSCATGMTFGPGFAFDGNQGLGCGGTANDGDPGNNWGDGGNLCGNRVFCWEVTTSAPTSACNAESYVTEVYIYGDGEAGSWSNMPCLNDEPLCWPEVTDATASVDMPCPGEPFTLTGNFDAEANCGVLIEWTGPGGFSSNDLVTTTTVEGVYTLNVNLDGCTSFSVDVTAMWDQFAPTLTPSPSATYCFGDPVTLTGTGGGTYTYTSPTGAVFTTNPLTFTADATTAGTWTLVVNSGPGCNETLTTDIIVLPELMPTATVMPIPVCEGDPLTFTGSGAGPGGTYSWGGAIPPSTNNPYTTPAPAPGNYIATLTITNSGGCMETVNVPFTVSPSPVVNLTAVPDAICEGGSTTITATGGGTYSWQPGGFTTPSITVSPTTTTTYTVTVTSADGCETIEDIVIDVQPELEAPQITCSPQNAANITWNWPPVPGADYYEIYIDGVLVDPFFTGTEYQLNGLDPETTATIQVIPFSLNNTNCPGLSTTDVCSSPPCEPIFFFLESPTEYCYDPTSGPILIAVGASGPNAGQGSLTWSGPGIFPPGNAPLNWFPPGPGVYVLTATHTLNDGSCPISQDYTFTILPGAAAGINAPADVCLNTPFTVSLAGFVNPLASYDWDFGEATVISGTGPGPYELSFENAGNYNISLTTDLDGCIAMDDVDINVEDTLTAPTIICEFIGENSVTFGWDDVVGASSYTVNVITGQSGTLSGNSFEVTGLADGEAVEITVTAISGNSCPDVTSAPHTCIPQSCPNSSVEVTTAPQIFCDDGENAAITLTLNLIDPVDPMDTIWSGPGVVDNTFDADLAGPGTHTVTVTVFMDECPFTDDVIFEVLPLPLPEFTVTDTVCVDSVSIIEYTGTADPAVSTFTWDFDGGTVMSGTGPGPYMVSWPAAGAYEVTLMLNDGNCASMLDTQIVTVVDPMPAPTVICINPQLDTITFEWTVDPAATGYEVNLLSGPAGTIIGNTYVVPDVMEGVEVTIEVIALGNGPCDNSAATEITCASRVCDAVNVTIDNQPIEFCIDEDPEFVVLTASTDSPIGGGDFSWSGPGVSNDTFYVQVAGVGNHTISVIYEEDGCTYTTDTIFTVFPTPTANLVFSLPTVCLDSTVVLTNEVAMLPNSTYSWGFDGGLASPATGHGPILLSWDTPGLKTVTLTLTVDGCPATFTQTIEVIEPLPAPTLNCGTNDLNSVTVDWLDVAGNLGYSVSVNGGPDSIVSNPSFTVTGLTPDSTVSISVFTLGDAPCGAGPAATINCTAAPCLPATADFTANPMAFCLDTMIDQTITLTTTINGGAGGGSIAYEGPGVSGNTFDPAIAGEGGHTIVMTYTEPGPCAFTDSFTITVFPLPEAEFALSADTICSTGTLVVSFTGTAPAGTTYNWDFGGATVVSGSNAGPYTLAFDAAGTFDINLDIEAPGSCTSIAPTQAVTVIAPLEPLVVECSESLLQEVTFSWGAIDGAYAYEVLYAGNLDTTMALSYGIDSLAPAQTVNITVRPLGLMPCGDGEPITASCTTDPCPDVQLEPAAVQTEFCTDGGDPAVLLELTATGGFGGGTAVWSGTGVVDNGDETFSFDPTGLAAGTYTLNCTYTEFVCPYTTTLLMEVFQTPESSFNFNEDSICANASTIVSFDGAAGPTATFDWDFAGAAVSDLGSESYELSWGLAGTYVIGLTVTENNCSTSFTDTVVVSAPLAMADPSCAVEELTSIIFEWPPVTGATGYLISIDAGEPFVVNGFAYEVTDLDPDQVVTMVITAIGPDPCGNSAPNIISCVTDPCPDVTLVPAAVQTAFCTEAGDPPVALELSATGGFGDGTTVWTGTGVVDNGDGTFSFDPTDLPPGSYPLTVTYTELVCPYTAELIMQVNQTPTASFSASSLDFCSTTSLLVSFNGSAAASAMLDWDFDGAAITSLGNNNYELNWTTAGEYTVGLVVNQFGCSSSTSTTVSVSEPPVAGQQVVDSEVCAGSGDIIPLATLVTGADPGGIWSPGIGSPAVVDAGTGILATTNLAAGTYTYLYTVAGGVCDDAVAEVEITVQPAPVANAGVDQTLTCAMGMVSLNGSGSTGGSELSYSWTGPDGNPVLIDPNSSMIDVAIPGTYTLEVTSDIGCSATDEVVVIADTEVPVPLIELSNITCFSNEDGTILVTGVSGGRPPYNYSLNGGAPSGATFFTGLDAGEYTVRVGDANGCFSEIVLDLTQPEQLTVSVELPNDQVQYNEGDLVTMTANIQGGNVIQSVIWEPDTLNRSGEANSNVITFVASETRTISVTVTDENGCRATDNATIIVDRERGVYIPSGFSPNGDNQNDILFIGANAEQVVNIQQFLIFNRWGEAVFENYDFQPNDPAQGWDGTHRNEPLNPAVFVYYAVVEFDDGEVKTYKGDVTLIR